MGKDFDSMEIIPSYGSMIDDIERITIIKALERYDGNQVAASKMLGLHRNTLRSKIRKFKIDIGRFKQ